MNKRVRLSVYLGATLQVDGQDWVKPSVSCDVSFDTDDPKEFPSDEELEKAWAWLWDVQIGPQADALFQHIKDLRRDLPPIEGFKEKPKPKRVVQEGDPVPEGDVYS